MKSVIPGRAEGAGPESRATPVVRLSASGAASWQEPPASAALQPGYKCCCF